MAKVMNKDVFHDGKHYKKGEEVTAEDKGFKSFMADGHLSDGTGEVSKDETAAETEGDEAESKPSRSRRGR